MYLTNLSTIQLILWNLLKRYDIDPQEVFRKVGLNPQYIQKAGKRYPVKKADELWKEAGRRIKDPCFGLEAIKCWHPSHLGPLGYAMLASRSLRISLECLVRFHQVISDIKFFNLVEDDRSRALVLILNKDRKGLAPLSPYQEDATMALVLGILRLNLQEDFSPLKVTFRHGPPGCKARYFELFRSPVVFNYPETSISISMDVADKDLPGANKEIMATNENLMIDYLESLDKEQLIPKMKRIIIEYLPTGSATLERVATHFYVSPRTLQRHLQAEGTTFKDVLDETRKELARRYVKESKLDFSEIAFLLGFSELSAFSRSFKRWTGYPPVRFRRFSQ